MYIRKRNIGLSLLLMIVVIVSLIAQATMNHESARADSLPPDTTIEPILDYTRNVSAISGNATADTANGSWISQVEIELNRSDNGDYWNGSDWQVSEIWITTSPVDGNFDSANELWTITTSTPTPLPTWVNGITYYITARAVDNDSVRDPTPASESFTIGNIGWDNIDVGIGDDFSGIWGNSSYDIFAIGTDKTSEQNVFEHCDGTTWNITDYTLGYNLFNIWGNSNSDVFAVGSSGTILHYDGNSWIPMESGVSATLYGIWGNSPTNVFAVGENGTILNYNGSCWTNMNSGTTDTLESIWGNSSADIFAVGYSASKNDSATILHYNGSSWNLMSSGVFGATFSVWGSNSSDVFAVGIFNTIIHYNGSAWTSIASVDLTKIWTTVWGTSESNIFVGGWNGLISHYDGTNWLPMYTGTGNNILNIWGNTRDVYAVGKNGTILHYNAYPDRSVFLNRPKSVAEGQNFSITVGISKTIDLYQGDFAIEYDPSLINVISPNVSNGSLYGNMTYIVPTAGHWSLNGSGLDNQGKIEITFDLSDCANPIGDTEGSLAVISFNAISHGTANLSFVTDSTLTDYSSSEIPISWYDDSVIVYKLCPTQLSTSSTTGGSVIAPGESGPYNYKYCSQVVDIVATNDSCHHFVNWSGTGVSAGSVADPNASSTTITMDNSYSVQANFAINTYTLSTTANNSGGVPYVDSSSPFNCSDSTSIHANTSPCYTFAGWTPTDGVANASAENTTVSMTQVRILTANYNIKTYTLLVNPNNSGGVPYIDGSSPFNCSDSASIHANTSPCYTFAGWTPTDGVANASAENTTVSMTQVRILTANYNVKTNSLTTSHSAGGHVTTPAEGIHNYSCGTVQNIIATADPCYYFVNWSGNTSTIADVSSPSTNITMNGNYSITANFAPTTDTYNLTINSSEHGNVTNPIEGTWGPYSCGHCVNLTAAADPGYQFISWTPDTGTIANPRSPSTNITMNGNYSITANFDLLPTGFYGDADRNGYLNILDYATVRAMLFGKRPFNPGGDADRNGYLNILDYATVRAMLFGKQPLVPKYEVPYDFLSGAGSNRWAKINTITSDPPSNNFDNDSSSWLEASPADYSNISLADSSVWSIIGTLGNYSALQCKFALAETPDSITSIGVTLNGSSNISGSTLRLWAWNFNTNSWTQVGRDFSMTTNISSYAAWTGWGKVFTNYINASNMFILATLNTANANLNIDYIELSVAHP